LSRTAKFKRLKRYGRLTFLVWCNGYLPSFTPISLTPLDYKNEKNWQLENIQERHKQIKEQELRVTLANIILLFT